MSHASTRRRRAAFALLAGLSLAACGGGDSADTLPANASAASASTLLDDDGFPMPSDPGAVPAGTPLLGTPRYATRAQADELKKALGAAARSVAAGCCGAAEVDAAILAALDPARTVPLAVLVESADPAAAMAVADGFQASGLERVWIVRP